jgi:uncharacterized membrane-anchored protein
MNKIIRTFFFLLVLAGLLTWGVSTLAQAPTASSVTTQGIKVEGKVLEHGQPITRDQIHQVR